MVTSRIGADVAAYQAVALIHAAHRRSVSENKTEKGVSRDLVLRILV